MAELVDAADSKSADLGQWEFDSPLGHHFYFVFFPSALFFIRSDTFSRVSLAPSRFEFFTSSAGRDDSKTLALKLCKSFS